MTATARNNPNRPLFVALALAIGIAAALAIAVVVLLWVGYVPIRESRVVRQMMDVRMANTTMASALNALVDEKHSSGWIAQRREHLKECYLNPASIDLDKISWNLLTQPSPFVGYLPVPGDQGGAHFNKLQLRDGRDLKLPKPAGVYRIFLSGGSLAYSIGAPSEEATISAYLERDLNKNNPWPGKTVEVWNASVPGWASTQERINFENRLAQWEPDMVICLTGGNDVHWSYLGHDSLNYREYEEQMYMILINSSLRAASAKVYGETPPVVIKGPVAPEIVAHNFDWNMRLIAAGLASKNAKLVIALQPTLSEEHKAVSPGEKSWLETKEETDAPGKVEYLAKCYAAMTSALNAKPMPGNTSVVPVLDVFKTRTDPIFTDLYHMGDKGNELLAKALAEGIVKEARR